MGQITASLFALGLLVLMVRHTALWMKKAVENARVLVQGQAELLALTFMGLGFFSSALPHFHELNSWVALWICKWCSSAFWQPVMLWSGPSSCWAVWAPGEQAGCGCVPLSHHVPQPSSNCRAVCVTGGMRGLPRASGALHDVHLQICSFILGPCNQQINSWLIG